MDFSFGHQWILDFLHSIIINSSTRRHRDIAQLLVLVYVPVDVDGIKKIILILYVCGQIHYNKDAQNDTKVESVAWSDPYPSQTVVPTFGFALPRLHF